MRPLSQNRWYTAGACPGRKCSITMNSAMLSPLRRTRSRDHGILTRRRSTASRGTTPAEVETVTWPDHSLKRGASPTALSQVSELSTRSVAEAPGATLVGEAWLGALLAKPTSEGMAAVTITTTVETPLIAPGVLVSFRASTRRLNGIGRPKDPA